VGGLGRLMREANLMVESWTSAVLYPRSLALTRAAEVLERNLAGRVCVGGAFIAVKGRKLTS
jgi:hypothetical protein